MKISYSNVICSKILLSVTKLKFSTFRFCYLLIWVTVLLFRRLLWNATFMQCFSNPQTADKWQIYTLTGHKFVTPQTTTIIIHQIELFWYTNFPVSSQILKPIDQAYRLKWRDQTMVLLHAYVINQCGCSFKTLSSNPYIYQLTIKNSVLICCL